MDTLHVQDVMQKHSAYVNDNDFMTYARQLMRDHYHRILPVVNEKRNVLGIISEKDILNITSTKSNITVQGFVTETPVITECMSLELTAKILSESGFTAIPVVDSLDDRTLKGVISVTDIFNNLDPLNIPEKRIDELMTKNVKTCTPDEPLAKIWNNMIREGYSGYPVVDKHNFPLGMITRRDIINSGKIRIEREDEHGTRIGTSSSISRIMSTPSYNISPKASIGDAIKMMIKYDVGRLCVVDQDKLVGIIDKHDAVRAYSNKKS
ncbi:MAG: CBS domain-containing protein [Nitrospirae bacterium]|nr:CBS domain-containing protein [Nitrospirota bacterium]